MASVPLWLPGSSHRLSRRPSREGSLVPPHPNPQQVQKLQRAALKDPVKCAVSSKYSTVDKLQQYYVFIPSKYKVGRLRSVPVGGAFSR